MLLHSGIEFNAPINLIANGYSFIASDAHGNSDHVTGCFFYGASPYNDNITATNFPNGEFEGYDGNDTITATNCDNSQFYGNDDNDIITAINCTNGFFSGDDANDILISTNWQFMWSRRRGWK